MGAHAAIMGSLYREGRIAGVDTDWLALRTNIAAARSLLDDAVSDASDRDLLIDRYDELGRIASVATCAQRAGQARLVDALAGLKGGEPDRKTAALLVLLELEAGRCTPGRAAACARIMALPEQIFRVWAFWTLDLNFYSAPPSDDPAWAEVTAQWEG